MSELPESKVCTKCKLPKLANEFYIVVPKKLTHKMRLSSRCRACSIKHNTGSTNSERRKRVYGLSDIEYQRLMDEQGGVCKICKRQPEGKQPWNIDHNHKTGVIRGLLCSRCNTGLGCFNDESNLIRQAALYVENDGKLP